MKNGIPPRGKEDSMTLAIDYQTVHTTQRQNTSNLLDHLYSISAALKEVREQKRLLCEQKYALFAQLHTLAEQQQAMITEESTLLQEEVAILAQLSCLRERL
jgi:hypothetical protein